MSRVLYLSGGEEVVVEEMDYNHLCRWSWHLTENGYAKRVINLGGGRYKSGMMHRLILGSEDGVQVDHINGNKLDNRRSNLRIATHAENQRNRGKTKSNTSGVKGVALRKGKWEARIRVDGKLLYLGRFDSIEEGAKAYDEAALKHHKQFANTNA